MTDPTSSDSSVLPLSGITIADFTRILAGPLCTMVLADLGADVIKIERPGVGDDTRSWGPPFVGCDAAYFLSINRNKRSIALDLNDPADLAVARELIQRADVLVENFRPGVMSKFGLDYHSVVAANPSLTYCSIPAFARSAEQADLPGYDLLMQALTGFMSITGEEHGQPVKMGVAILDVVAGLYSAVAILAALRSQKGSGQGRHVQVGLFEAGVASLINQAANYLLGEVVPTMAGNAHPNIVPYQAFAASDGMFILAAGNDKLFQAACRAMDRPELGADPRFSTNSNRVENRHILIAQLQQTFSGARVEHWTRLMSEAGVPAAPVRSIDEVLESDEAQAMISEVADPVRGSLRLVGSPMDNLGIAGGAITPPPLLDEHGAEIRDWLASGAAAKKVAR